MTNFHLRNVTLSFLQDKMLADIKRQSKLLFWKEQVNMSMCLFLPKVFHLIDFSFFSSLVMMAFQLSVKKKKHKYIFPATKHPGTCQEAIRNDKNIMTVSFKY